MDFHEYVNILKSKYIGLLLSVNKIEWLSYLEDLHIVLITNKIVKGYSNAITTNSALT